MRYQLVLQFRGDMSADLDRLVHLEDQLIAALGESAEVDGHDIGAGEANIYIFTDNPPSTFALVEPILLQLEVLEDVVAAFRLVSGSTYTMLRPLHSTHAFRVA